MNTVVFQAMNDELAKIAYMTAAGPQYAGNMPPGMGTGMVSAQQAQQMTRMPGVRSMRRGGIVPKGKTQVAVLHGEEAVVPLKNGKPTRRGKKVLEQAEKEKKAVSIRFKPARGFDPSQEAAMAYLTRRAEELGHKKSGLADHLKEKLKNHPEYRAYERGMYQGARVNPEKVREFLEELRGIGGNRARFAFGNRNLMSLPPFTFRTADGKKGKLRAMIEKGQGAESDLATFFQEHMFEPKKHDLLDAYGIDSRGGNDGALFQQVRNLIDRTDLTSGMTQQPAWFERLVPAMIYGELEAKGTQRLLQKKRPHHPELSAYVKDLLRDGDRPGYATRITDEMKQRAAEMRRQAELQRAPKRRRR